MSYSAVTERLYSKLPAFMRASDTDELYKKYIEAIGSQMQIVTDLIDRIEYVSPEAGVVGDTSDLANPYTADAAWLPWLSQLMGSGLTQEPTREALAAAAAGYKAGTKESIVAVVKTVLSGDKIAEVASYEELGLGGTMWDLMITTRASETLINLIPQWLATAADPNVFNKESSQNLGISKVADSLFYNGLAAKFYSIDGTNIATSSVKMNSQFPVTGSDPLTYMYSATGVGTATVTPSIAFYTAAGAFISTTTGSTVTPNASIINYTNALALTPATAAFAVMSFTFANISGTNNITMGMYGARREPATDWVPKTADPAQVVIDAGAKPAGFVLHNRTSSTTWAALEAAYPTWAAIEGDSWADVEETTII